MNTGILDIHAQEVAATSELTPFQGEGSYVGRIFLHKFSEARECGAAFPLRESLCTFISEVTQRMEPLKGLRTL